MSRECLYKEYTVIYTHTNISRRKTSDSMNTPGFATHALTTTPGPHRRFTTLSLPRQDNALADRVKDVDGRGMTEAHNKCQTNAEKKFRVESEKGRPHSKAP